MKEVIKIIYVLALNYFIILIHSQDKENPAYKYNRECKLSTRGSDYTGTKNTTTSGLICQAWSSQTPHRHTSTDGRYFADASLREASNFCRNPANAQKDSPWCYTTDINARWQYCDVQDCSHFEECKLNANGSDYMGHANIGINSGTYCQPWDSIGYPGESNYCYQANVVDGMNDGPYCFTYNNEWEYCDVRFCKPSSRCLTNDPLGRNYVGSVAVTSNGRLCQRWDSQFPHAHEFTDPSNFPDATVSDASNMCRNPNNDVAGPWCFTLDINVERESCDIPICKDCKSSFEGENYAGTRSHTASGKICLHWDSLINYQDIKNPDRFPDANLENASNYCRNPDRDPAGPWCYISDTNTTNDKESCAIPDCDDKKPSSTFQKQLARHVVHIGVDGLRPCFVNSSSGANNVIDRVAKAGSSTLTMARSVLTTVSAPNWLATVCAMSPESSGTTDNSWKSPWLGFPQDITPIFGDSMPFPCIWKEIKSQDRNIRTAVFTDWDWWHYVSSMGLPKALDYEYTCDARAPLVGTRVCDEFSIANATEYLASLLNKNQTSYTFIYFLNVDETGHTFGWCGNEYMNAVDTVNEQIGRILDVVDEFDVGETSVYVSTDHGGHGRNHGDFVDTDIVIPMFMRGPGIKQNYEFQHEVRNTDITPTIFRMLGLRKNLWWDGKIIDEAFAD